MPHTHTHTHTHVHTHMHTQARACPHAQNITLHNSNRAKEKNFFYTGFSNIEKKNETPLSHCACSVRSKLLEETMGGSIGAVSEEPVT